MPYLGPDLWSRTAEVQERALRTARIELDLNSEFLIPKIGVLER